MRYIDAFNHFNPPRYHEALLESPSGKKDIGKRVRGIAALWDLERRLAVVEQFPDYSQVISLGMPMVDRLWGPDQSPEMAKLANDGLAEVVAKNPKHFAGYTAVLPMNAPAAAAKSHRQISEAVETTFAPLVPAQGTIERTKSDDQQEVSVLELRSATPGSEEVTAMSWAGDSRLVVVGREQGGVQQTRYVQVDGSTPDGQAPAALTGVKAITASEDERVPLVAYSEDGIVRLPTGAQWQKVDKDGTAPVYPG